VIVSYHTPKELVANAHAGSSEARQGGDYRGGWGVWGEDRGTRGGADPPMPPYDPSDPPIPPPPSGNEGDITRWGRGVYIPSRATWDILLVLFQHQRGLTNQETKAPGRKDFVELLASHLAALNRRRDALDDIAVPVQ